MQLQQLADGLHNLITNSSPAWWPELAERCPNWVSPQQRQGADVAPEGWEITHVAATRHSVLIEVDVTATVGWRRLVIPASITINTELEVYIIESNGPAGERDDELAELRAAALNADLPPAIRLLAPVSCFGKGQILLLNEGNYRYQAAESIHDPLAASVAGGALAGYPQLYRAVRSFP